MQRIKIRDEIMQPDIVFITIGTLYRGGPRLLALYAKALSRYTSFSPLLVLIQEGSPAVSFYSNENIPIIELRDKFFSFHNLFGIKVGDQNRVKLITLFRLIRLLKEKRIKEPLLLHIGSYISNTAIAYASLKNIINSKVIIHTIYHPLEGLDLKQEIIDSNLFLNQKIKSRILFLLLKHVVKKADGVTVSTPYEYFLLKKLKQKRVFFIGEGIDTDYIKRMYQTLSRQDEERIMKVIGSDNYVLYIGNTSIGKGYDITLKAMLYIYRKRFCRNERLRLVVIGTSSKLPLHINLLEKKLINNKIVIKLGIVDEKIKYFLLERAKTVVIPSLRETIPLAFLEAFYFKKPVIGLKIPTLYATMLLCKERFGILIPRRSAEVLAKSIIELIDDDQLSKNYGASGYRCLMKYFTLDKIALRLKQAYDITLRV